MITLAQMKQQARQSFNAKNIGTTIPSLKERNAGVSHPKGEDITKQGQPKFVPALKREEK